MLWYAGRHWTLWVLLIGLPLAVVVIGCTTWLRSWMDDAGLRESARQALAAVHQHLAMFLIAVASLVAGGVLAVVALHMLAN